MTKDIQDSVRQAGVVGAGGAGFPTHVKLGSEVDTYIANAAECEPLLCKDQELMELHAGEMVHGLRLAMEATGARRGVIAIKKKYTTAIERLAAVAGPGIEFHLMDNFYPAGDEVLIVYDVGGRLIPPGGLPLHVGCAVNNVETLINVSRAMSGTPVTTTALTVAGAVEKPVSAVVPLGVTAREVLTLAGGATVEDPVLIDGGAMMGSALSDLDEPVTKTSGGYIVLPRDHYLVGRKTLARRVEEHISRSACDQCRFCTELCPRYLLGYAVEPHAVMRSVGFVGEQEAHHSQLGLQCCECSACSLYACPEGLPPASMCVRSKELWRERGERPEPLPGLGRVHPMRDARRIPIPRLVRRLGLAEWDVHAPMVASSLAPSRVQLRLRQHIGAPGTPVVREGESVALGQVVAEVPEGQLGVPLHASIAGRVGRIDDDSIWIER